MAEIFRAMSFGAEGFKKLVAIKRILPELSKDHQFVDMFINEAKIVANLNHPNIVQTFDFGNIEGQLYHCMEYVHGKNLSDIICNMLGEDPATTVEPACYIMLEVLNGLEQAHRQSDSLGSFLNIIHRDISPSNILVSYDGEVKIADFGIAKAAQTTVNTVGGMVKGKYRYLSPEQGKGEPLDQRTDIFSLGICFYETLTLKEMYAEASGLLALEQVTTAKFKKPREVNPAIPEALEKILLKALARDREDRYASAGEFREALVGFMGEHKIHLSRNWLSKFMLDRFSRSLGAERAQLAQEDQLAEQLRPEANVIAKMETDAAAGLKTMIVDLAKEGMISLSEAPYGEGEDSLEDTAEMTVEEAIAKAKIQQGDDDIDGDDIVTQEKKLSDIMAKVSEEEESVTDRSPLGAHLGDGEDESTVQNTLEKVAPQDPSKFAAKTRAEPAAAQRGGSAKPPEAEVPPPLPLDRAVTLETLISPPTPRTSMPTGGRPPARKVPAHSGLPPGTPVRTPSPHVPDRIDQVAAQEPEKERSALFYVVFILLGLVLGMGLFSLYLALSK
jgi:hypothetical protein